MSQKKLTLPAKQPPAPEEAKPELTPETEQAEATYDPVDAGEVTVRAPYFDVLLEVQRRWCIFCQPTPVVRDEEVERLIGMRHLEEVRGAD